MSVKRKRLILIGSGLALILLCGIAYCFIRQAFVPREMPHFVAHACGSLADGTTRTNSVEAADLSYKRGYRWLEADFCWTSDGQLICLHDWGTFYWDAVTGVPTPCTAAQFEVMRKTIYDFESFTVPVLKKWLRRHPGAMIVTDVKENNVAAMEWIAKNYPELKSRLVVQIYHPDEFEAVSTLGFPNIILTIYLMSDQDRHNNPWFTDFVKNSGIQAVVMPASEACMDVFEAVLKTGVPIYVHTVNEKEEQQRWFDLGAYGVYIDYTE